MFECFYLNNLPLQSKLRTCWPYDLTLEYLSLNLTCSYYFLRLNFRSRLAVCLVILTSKQWKFAKQINSSSANSDSADSAISFRQEKGKYCATLVKISFCVDNWEHFRLSVSVTVLLKSRITEFVLVSVVLLFDYRTNVLQAESILS